MEFGYFCFLLFALLITTTSTTNEKHRTRVGATFISGIAGEDIQLPCDLALLSPNDSISLVLWYRDLFGTPIYSYDLRDGVKKHWWSKSVLGDRAMFHVEDTGETSQQGGKILKSYLKIKQTQPSDSGPYRCRIDFLQGPTRNTKMLLSLIELPSRPIIFDGDNLEVLNKTAPLRINSTLDLRCESYGGSPVPHMSWWWRRTGSREMPLISESTFVHGSNVSSRLKLPPIQRDDLGTIIGCAVSNTNLTRPINTSFKIDILLPPTDVRLVRDVDYFLAGQEYNVSCLVKGSNPTADIQIGLSKRDFKVKTSLGNSIDYLTTAVASFTPGIDDDGKILTCSGDNSLMRSALKLWDSWTINVRFPPVLSLSIVNLKFNSGRENVSSFYAVNEDDEFELMCALKANPEAGSIKWTKNNDLITFGAKNDNLYSYNDGKSLKIRRIQREHTGSYLCEAENTVGIGKSNAVNIKVHYSPYCALAGPEIRFITPGDQVVLSCPIDALPSENISFDWIFYQNVTQIDLANQETGIPLKDFETFSMRSELTYFSSLSGMDYGLIECKAQNSVGRQKEGCFFKIKPKTPPEIIECHLSKITLEGVQIGCSLQATSSFNQNQIDNELRIEIFPMPPFASKSQHQLTLNASRKNPVDFQVVGLEHGIKYRMAISTIYRRTNTTSNPFYLHVQIPPVYTPMESSTSQVFIMTTQAQYTVNMTTDKIATTEMSTVETYSTTANQKPTEKPVYQTDLNLESKIESETSQQVIQFLGVIFGIITVIFLTMVLGVTIRRYSFFPSPANPQTSTHISFAANIDHPVDVELSSTTNAAESKVEIDKKAESLVSLPNERLDFMSEPNNMDETDVIVEELRKLEEQLIEFDDEPSVLPEPMPVLHSHFYDLTSTMVTSSSSHFTEELK